MSLLEALKPENLRLGAKESEETESGLLRKARLV
jgi:hypothetical protein